METNSPMRSGLRVLVIDADRVAAEALAKCLEALGAEVASAHDEGEARRVAEALRPDLALVDLATAELRRVRGLPSGRRELECVALAPVASREVVVACFRELAFGVLVKPVDAEDVRAVLARFAGPPREQPLGPHDVHEGPSPSEPRPGAPPPRSPYETHAAGDEARPSRPDPAPAKARVMVVDDERFLVDGLVMLLTDAGYATTGFTDPRAALRAFEGTPAAWDVLIVDQTMPAMTGLRFARAVRARRPDLPIILSSGYAAETGTERVGGLRIDAVVHKPFEAETILAALRGALQRSERGAAAPARPGSDADLD